MLTVGKPVYRPKEYSPPILVRWTRVYCTRSKSWSKNTQSKQLLFLYEEVASPARSSLQRFSCHHCVSRQSRQLSSAHTSIRVIDAWLRHLFRLRVLCAALAVRSCLLLSYFAYVNTPITLVLEDRPLVIITPQFSLTHTLSLTRSLAHSLTWSRSRRSLTMSRARAHDLCIYRSLPNAHIHIP